MSRTYGKAQDLIDFTRASSVTALRRVKYGAELVTNGTFDSSDGWSLFGGATISGGVLTVISSGEGVGAQQNILTIGKVYFITVDVVVRSGAVKVQLGSASQTPYIISSSGTYTFARQNDGTDGNLFLVRNAACDADFDNVSVKEVTFDTSDGDLVLFNHPKNIPRIEYDADGNLLGLLVEESRTNLITYSESFDNSSYWTLLFSTLESGYSAPDGSNNAYLLTASRSNYYIYRSGAHVGLTTISMFMKAGTSNIGGLYSTGGISCLARFNLSTGTVDLAQDCTATITAVGNGWYRCSATYTNTSAGNMGFFMPNTTAGDSVYIFGFQSEAGAFPTSYVPSNSGSTTTRSADVASLSTSAFGYNGEAGTLYVEVETSTTEIARYALLYGGATGNGGYLSLGSDGDQAWLETYDGNVANLFSSKSSVGTYDGKLASGFNLNGNSFAFNGSIIGSTTNSTANPQSVTDLYIGVFNNKTQLINGHIKSLKYYPRRLTNDQLVELTS